MRAGGATMLAPPAAPLDRSLASRNANRGVRDERGVPASREGRRGPSDHRRSIHEPRRSRVAKRKLATVAVVLTVFGVTAGSASADSGSRDHVRPIGAPQTPPSTVCTFYTKPQLDNCMSGCGKGTHLVTLGIIHDE